MACRSRGLLWAVVLLAAGVVNADAQWGGGYGGGLGGGGGTTRRQSPRGNPEQMKKMIARLDAIRVLPVEAMWTALSLGMTLGEDQLVTLKPVMVDAWKQRQQLLAEAQPKDTWEEAKQKLNDLKDKVDVQVEAALTKDQQKEYKKLLQQQDNMNNLRRF